MKVRMVEGAAVGPNEPPQGRGRKEWGRAVDACNFLDSPPSPLQENRPVLPELPSLGGK